LIGRLNHRWSGLSKTMFVGRDVIGNIHKLSLSDKRSKPQHMAGACSFRR
jgi:hypothetical protein